MDTRETAALIKSIRIRNGMTQEELAEKAEMSTRSIQRIENGNVSPRPFNIRKIADALDVPYEELNSHMGEIGSQKHSLVWLTLIHASGLFLVVLPTVLIWIWKKDRVPEIRQHAMDVINFQLNLLLILVPCGIFAILMITIPIIVLIGIMGSTIILINTFRVALELPYKYPLIYSFLKP